MSRLDAMETAPPLSDTSRMYMEASELDFIPVSNGSAAPTSVIPLRRWPCEACEKTFSSQSVRDRHMRIHTGEKRFSCHYPGCSKRFARHDYLRSHWLTHEDLPPQGVANSDDAEARLQVHVNLKNSLRGANQFPCQHEGCDEVFKGPNRLIEHQKVHNDPRPFKCPICGKGLSRNDKLTVHIRRHNEQKHVVYLPLDDSATSTKFQRVKVPTETQHPVPAPRPRGRPPVLRPGQHHDCHLCGKRFGRSTDLKRHLASSVHTYPGNAPSEVESVPRSQAQRDFPCSVCGKAFSRRTDRDRHMASPNVHRDVWRPDQRSFSANVSPYAQKCIGCGQAFREETSFYSHAPCYQQAAALGGHASSEAGEDTEEDDEDAENVVEDAALLDDFEAQLLAAANDAPDEQNQGTRKRQRNAQDPGSDATSSRQATLVSHEGEFRAQDPPGRAAFRNQTIVQSRTARIDRSQLGEGATTAVRSADMNQSRSAASPHSRLCYGCGKVFWDSEGFWMHSPCFTTTAEKAAKEVLAPAPTELARGETVNTIKVTASPAPIPTGAHLLRENELNADNLDEQSKVSKQQNPSPKTVKLAIAHLERVIDTAPSVEVQRLLIDIAQNNVDARPLPPDELHSLMRQGPDMYALVTKMERDNAELQLWLKNNGRRNTTQHSTKPETTVPSRPSQGDVRWACEVSEETMANIHCYAKPGEDLDWTKITDRMERRRLQDIIKNRRRRERERHAQGQSGSGGDYPGADGVRGFLSKDSGSGKRLLDSRLHGKNELNRLKRKVSHEAELPSTLTPMLPGTSDRTIAATQSVKPKARFISRQAHAVRIGTDIIEDSQSRATSIADPETKSKYFPHNSTHKRQQHSLRTSTGLRLNDSTDHDYEQVIEDDEP